jgi:hypothetical protein
VSSVSARVIRLVGAVAIAGLVATGCSTVVAGRAFPAGDGGAAADPAAGAAPAVVALPDACSLLTLDEATALAKADLAAGEGAGVENGAATLCQFVGNPSGPVAQVEVFTGDGAKKALDIDRQLDHDIVALPGVGEEAYEEDGQVFLRKGAVWASVRLVRLTDPAENRVPLRTAATLVAGRM